MNDKLEKELQTEESTINIEEISKENCFLTALNDVDNSDYDIGLEPDTTLLKH